MQKVKNWFIRNFGLRGSFFWALAQMERGAFVMRANALAPIGLFNSLNPLGISKPFILHKGSSMWDYPAFSIADLKATDWIICPTTDGHLPNPDN